MKTTFLNVIFMHGKNISMSYISIGQHHEYIVIRWCKNPLNDFCH